MSSGQVLKETIWVASDEKGFLTEVLDEIKKEVRVAYWISVQS